MISFALNIWLIPQKRLLAVAMRKRSLRIQPTVVGTRTFAELMAWGIAH